MAEMPGFVLDSAATADRLTAELEKFLVFWLGPRREGFGQPKDVLDAHPLPEPLRRLYAIAGRWTRPHPDVDEETEIFSIQEHLRSPDRLERTPGDKLIFLDENQGN